MANTNQEKMPTDEELTKALRNAAQKLPYAQRQHIDISRIKARLSTAPTTAAEKRSGNIAAVRNGSRDTVDIIDPKTFMQHVTQLTGHEVQHLIQNSTSDADQAKFAKNPTPDPYNYGGTQGLIQARAQGKKLQDFSPEQQAEILQYAQAHNDTYDQGSPEGKAQWDAQKPIYDQFTNDLNDWKITAPPDDQPPITSDNDPRLNVGMQIPDVPATGTIPPAQQQPVVLQQQQSPVQPQQTVQTGTFHATNVYAPGDPAPGEPSTPAGVSFDAPLSQATTVPVSTTTSNSASGDSGVPAGVSFDDPLQTATTVAIPASNQPVSNTVTPQPVPQATISATPGSMPNDPMSMKLQNWSNNVTSDLLHGTNITGVGKLLKSLGAHGLDFGVSPQVAQFMGSLPLGLLRTTKGAAELPQTGQRWQGTKDIAGGALQAATIPASVVSPETGELAGEGLGSAGDAIASQASNAAKAVKAPFTLESIQPELQQGIRDAVNGAAKELGVQPSASASIRDVANDVAQAAKAKAHGLYQQLDNAVGGTRFQTYQEQLDDAMQDLRNSISEADPDAHGELIEKINNLESAKQKAYQAVKDAGMDPEDIYTKAQNLWRRGSALEDFGTHVEKSTSGMRPELAADANKTNPETVSTTKLFPRANQMYNDSRLQVALGEQKAKQLLQAVDAAHLRALKVAANQKVLKLAGRLALYGGGYEAVRHGASHILGE